MSVSRVVTIADTELQAKYQQYEARWQDCNRCTIGASALHHVICRGALPCHILFIGEAPGPSEDAIGVPFIGPSGSRILNPMIQMVGKEYRFTYAIANVVCCMPSDKVEEKSLRYGRRFRKPNPDEIVNCRDHLEELIRFANPDGIVYLGLTATNNPPRHSLPEERTIALSHPSYIMRQGGVNTPQFKNQLALLLNFVHHIVGDKNRA